MPTIPARALEIIAHRGASHDAPENTLPAFALGWQQQADADELDIHLTQDGQIVVIHDGNTKRTAGRDELVANQTLEALQRLDAGSWKGAAWAGANLPALNEVLATVPDGRRLFIEIKCGAEVLPELERVLGASGRKPEQLVLIGFNYGTMQQAKARFPQLAVYWLASYDKDQKKRPAPDLDTLLAKAQAAHLDGLNLNAGFPIDAAVVTRVKAAGLRLYVWTVDDPAVASRLAVAGVDGITTNRPAWLRAQLRQGPAP